MDQAVFDCVLADLIQSVFPGIKAGIDASDPVLRLSVLDHCEPRCIEPSDVVARAEGSRWSTVRESDAASLREAASDFALRARAGYIGLTTTNPLVRVVADRSGPKIPPIITLPAPGYGFGCNLAIVQFSFVNGFHPAEATYLVRRSSSGWEVVVRDIVMHP